MSTFCMCVSCYNERLDATDAPWWEHSIMHVCADCGNKRCPRSTFHGYDCNRSNEPGQVATITGPARMADEINQIKADPRAYFSALPRPKRLKPTPTMRRRFARWLLHVADRVEATAYLIDDRVWSTPWQR